MTQTTTLDDAAEIAVAHLQQAFPLQLWLLTEVDGGQRTVLASAGPWALRYPPRTLLPWLGSLCLAMTAGGPRVAPDIAAVPRYLATAVEPRSGVRGYVGVPVARLDATGGADDLIGCLSGFSDTRDDPAVTAAAPTLAVLGSLLSVVADAARVTALDAQRLTQAQRHAMTDALTGLSNRRGWDEALAAVASRGVPCGMVVVDLDGLKHLNDSRGHAAGDMRLRLTAGVLTAACRGEDVVSRSGGDEFAILVQHVDVDVLRARLRRHLDRAGVAASLGVATQRRGEDLASTWTRADLSMLADKRDRRVLRRMPESELT